MRKFLMTLAIFAAAVPVAAQQATTPPPAAPRPAIAQTPAPAPRVQQPRPATPAPTPAAAQATPPAPPRPEVVPTQNVRVELTISDSMGGPTPGAPAKKTVTILIADGMNGRVRSTNTVRPNPTEPWQSITINVDANARVRAEGRVQLTLTFEYTPDINTASATPSGGLNSRPASISESISVLVPDGKTTLISQSADPASDRKVTVEVTATIVK
jgi:hypothetical protein